MASLLSKSEIANRLRMAREAAGLTQAQAAKILNLHRPSVSEIEAGRRNVSAEELALMADTYSVSVDWLTTDADATMKGDDKVLAAARQLANMKDEDLDRLMRTIQMIRRSGDKK